jgi:hypothetical protein
MAVIRKEILIRAPRKLLWRYFSDANLLAAWMMRNDFTAAPGESFSFFAEPSGLSPIGPVSICTWPLQPRLKNSFLTGRPLGGCNARDRGQFFDPF